MRHVLSVLVASCLFAVGCVGAPDVYGASASGLVEVDPDTEPLAELGGDAWRAAPAGCEDRLGVVARITFHLASLRDGLVAAVDRTGHIVCVDTVESVQAELEEQGEEERADELGDRYLVAATRAAAPTELSLVAADPTPQPNVQFLSGEPCDATGTRCGDPTPQPNTESYR